MNFYKKLKRIVCLGLSLVTVYGTSVLAEQRDFYNSAALKDISVLSFLDNQKSYEIDDYKKDIVLSFKTDTFEADVTGKVSETGLMQTDIGLDFDRYFNAGFRASNLADSDTRKFEFTNSSILNIGKLEEKIVFDKDMKVSTLNIGFANSKIDFFYKKFNRETKKGNIFHLGINPVERLKVGYGFKNLKNNNEYFVDSLFHDKNLFLSAAIIKDGYSLKGGGTCKGMGLFFDYRDVDFDEDKYDIIFATNPNISRSDFELIDESSYETKGAILFKDMKPLRSFTDKGVVLRYSEYDDNSRFEGAWNAIDFDEKKIDCSIWFGLDYSNIVEKVQQSVSVDLDYDDFSFTGKYRTNGNMNFKFGYKIKF